MSSRSKFTRPPAKDPRIYCFLKSLAQPGRHGNKTPNINNKWLPLIFASELIKLRRCEMDMYPRVLTLARHTMTDQAPMNPQHAHIIGLMLAMTVWWAQAQEGVIEEGSSLN